MSLAVALAVPAVVSSGEPFRGRDEIVFVTTGVVLLTLLVQGLLLPLIVRWARFEADTTFDDEVATAESDAPRDALDHIHEIASDIGVSDEVRDAVTTQYEEHAALNPAPDDDDDKELQERGRQEVELRLTLIERKRNVMIELRDNGTISDTALRTLQTRLDREALRLSQPDILE